jgi:hypothetical protein
LLTRTGVFGVTRAPPEDALVLGDETALPLDRHPVAVNRASLTPGLRSAPRPPSGGSRPWSPPRQPSSRCPGGHATSPIRRRSGRRGRQGSRPPFRTGSFDAVRGTRVPKRRALARGDLTARLEVCDSSTAGRGAKRGAPRSPGQVRVTSSQDRRAGLERLRDQDGPPRGPIVTTRSASASGGRWGPHGILRHSRGRRGGTRLA